MLDILQEPATTAHHLQPCACTGTRRWPSHTGCTPPQRPGTAPWSQRTAQTAAASRCWRSSRQASRRADCATAAAHLAGLAGRLGQPRWLAALGMLGMLLWMLGCRCRCCAASGWVGAVGLVGGLLLLLTELLAAPADASVSRWVSCAQLQDEETGIGAKPQMLACCDRRCQLSSAVGVSWIQHSCCSRHYPLHAEHLGTLAALRSGYWKVAIHSHEVWPLPSWSSSRGILCSSSV